MSMESKRGSEDATLSWNYKLLVLCVFKIDLRSTSPSRACIAYQSGGNYALVSVAAEESKSGPLRAKYA